MCSIYYYYYYRRRCYCQKYSENDVCTRTAGHPTSNSCERRLYTALSSGFKFEMELPARRLQRILRCILQATKKSLNRKNQMATSRKSELHVGQEFNNEVENMKNYGKK